MNCLWHQGTNVSAKAPSGHRWKAYGMPPHVKIHFPALHFADHSHTHNRIMDSHTQHMAGSKWCLSGYPLQSALIGIHYQSLELGGACFEKVITAKWYNPLHYKSADGILITGELNPEMQSHFPPGENTLQYLCHYSSDAQAAFYLYSSILPVLFGEMKADTDKGGFFVCPFTNSWEGGPINFLRNFHPKQDELRPTPL